MHATHSDPAPLTPSPQETVIVQTTLYDLIAAINADIPPEEDHLVTSKVLRILESSGVNFSPGEKNL